MTVRPRTLARAAAALGLLASGCSHSPAGDAADAAPAPSASGPKAEGSWLSQRDPSLRKPGPAPGAAVLPQPTHPPDWDLDKADPARDYVRRYVFYTRRYGDAGATCAVLGPSQPAGDKRRVQVTTPPGCPGAGDVRDVFVVDLAGDRLTVDDKTKRDPLARWPDGSDPEGPALDPVREIDDMRKWTVPLDGILRALMLIPVRVQAYGRGTYPVVSIAGWHGAVQLGAPPEALKPLADQACAANSNMPLGILAAMDRTRIMRINCPANTRWDAL